jgi:hypothetical protein
MPLEINEIDIAMRVTDEDARRERLHVGTEPPAPTRIDRENLIDECVRRVLQALKSRDEP